MRMLFNHAPKEGNMNLKKLSSILLVCVLATSIIYFMPENAFARAGGGGGGGKGGILTIILLPFLIVYSAILTHLVRKKNRESKKLLAKIEAIDSSWDLNKIKARIEIAFFKIQEAWMARDQDIAKEYMSERLYNKHKAQTDQMIKENRINNLERINLKEAKVVEVVDYVDDSKDRLWVYIEGSMIDYIVNSETGEHISGETDETEDFSELWKFMKNYNNEWVLDEIDQSAGIFDLRSMNSFSQAVENT